MEQNDLELHLRQRLGGAHRLAVVGIGDRLVPHDRLGMLAAEAIADLHLAGVRVFLAGTVPESVTGPIRRFMPDHVLFLDAAEMGATPGTVAIVDPESIHVSLLSTHVLPLHLVMEFLEKDVNTRVTLIGLQPDIHAREREPTPGEQEGLRRLLAALKGVWSGPR